MQRGQDGVRRRKRVLPAGLEMHIQQGGGHVRRLVRGRDALLQLWQRHQPVLPARRVVRLLAERVHAAQHGSGRRVDAAIYDGGRHAAADGACIFEYIWAG